MENRRTHRQTLAFHVLGAYGYPGGARRGRVWALHASHQAQQGDWEAFLRSLDVSEPPKLVITDGSAAIANTVRAVWPAQPGPSLPMPVLARCEHHLHVNGVEAMEDDGIGGWAHWLRRRLDTAFGGPRAGRSCMRRPPASPARSMAGRYRRGRHPGRGPAPATAAPLHRRP